VFNESVQDIAFRDDADDIVTPISDEQGANFFLHHCTKGGRNNCIGMCGNDRTSFGIYN
jgi:hypothetical protein